MTTENIFIIVIVIIVVLFIIYSVKFVIKRKELKEIEKICGKWFSTIEMVESTEAYWIYTFEYDKDNIYCNVICLNDESSNDILIYSYKKNGDLIELYNSDKLYMKLLYVKGLLFIYNDEDEIVGSFHRDLLPEED